MPLRRVFNPTSHFLDLRDVCGTTYPNRISNRRTDNSKDETISPSHLLHHFHLPFKMLLIRTEHCRHTRAKIDFFCLTVAKSGGIDTEFLQVIARIEMTCTPKEHSTSNDRYCFCTHYSTLLIKQWPKDISALHYNYTQHGYFSRPRWNKIYLPTTITRFSPRMTSPPFQS